MKKFLLLFFFTLSVQEANNATFADVGGIKLHYHHLSGKTPTVVIDAGMGCTSNEWNDIQEALSHSGVSVFTYDRAGYGLSETSPHPRTSVQIAQELHDLLHEAKIQGPYILLGHSFGGINVRNFAALFPNQVTGMVLVDASSEYQVQDLAHTTTKIQKTLEWIMKYTPNLAWGLIRLIRTLPSSLNKFVPTGILHMSYQEQMTVSEELRLFNSSLLDLAKLNPSLKDIPLVVITATQQPEDRKDIWMRLQQDFLVLSSNSFHLKSNSGHMVHLQDPKIIKQAIDRILLQTTECP